jgi:glycerol-3-phosphate acyltransferase PlsX
VRGVCVIGHGSSNDRAIFNGIRVAYEFAHAGTNERIEQEFLRRPNRRPGTPGEDASDATIH